MSFPSCVVVAEIELPLEDVVHMVIPQFSRHSILFLLLRKSPALLLEVDTL